MQRHPKPPSSLKSALDLDLKHLGKQKLAFFIDYDGTLMPLASHPEEALLKPDVRQVLATLALAYPVTIISGRDRSNLIRVIQLPQLIYAGNHGFDIAGNSPTPIQHAVGDEFIPHLKNIFLRITEQLNNIPGIYLQEKKYALAVHYQHVEKFQQAMIIAKVQSLVEDAKTLKTKAGKDVIEICPNVTWDKGQGMKWIVETLQLNSAEFFHIYIGDDISDEDAFKLLPKNGMGILVGDHGQASYADYHLSTPKEVKRFLDQFIPQF